MSKGQCWGLSLNGLLTCREGDITSVSPSQQPINPKIIPSSNLECMELVIGDALNPGPETGTLGSMPRQVTFYESHAHNLGYHDGRNVGYNLFNNKRAHKHVWPQMVLGAKESI